MRDRVFYANSYTTDELRRLIIRAEDRSTRADTTEDYMADAYAIQEMSAALGILEERNANADL